MTDEKIWELAAKHSGLIAQQRGPDQLAFDNAKALADCIRAIVEHGPIYNLENICFPYTGADGSQCEGFDENAALGCLLLGDVVFCNERKYVEIDGTAERSTTVIFANCNDVFVWAYADGEELLNDDIKPLFLAWHADKIFGPTRWVCIKRQEKPQSPIVKDMKKAGVWDDVMEALPDNTMDAYYKNKATPA